MTTNPSVHMPFEELRRMNAEINQRGRNHGDRVLKNSQSGLDVSPFNIWRPAVEHVAVTLLQNGARSFGVMGVEHQVGTTTFAKMLAQVWVQSGLNALLVDMTRAAESGESATSWSPHEGDAASSIALDGNDVPTLLARPFPDNRLHFHETSGLKAMFGQTLVDYAPIVVDLASAVGRDPSSINPLGAAAACDAVILVCSRGRTTRAQMLHALEFGQAARVNFVGVIMNEYDYVSPAAEIGRNAMALFWFAPPLARWVQNLVHRSALLN